MVEFERFVVIINPASSQAHKVSPRIKNLREHFPVAYEEVLTSEDSERTTEDILNKLQPGDLCLNAGGDGTEQSIMHALIASDTEVPLLPLWGGNGNDKAHMLNGNPPFASHTHELLKKGEVVDIHPIEIAMSSLRTKLAGNYAGFGATAEGARELNLKTYRSRSGYNLRPIRAVYEARTLAATPFQAEAFTYTINGGEESAIDITFANGNRMAKYGHPRARLTEKEIFLFLCQTRTQVPLWASTLVAGIPQGEKIHWGEHHLFQLGQTVLAHVDAETFSIPAHTEVRVGIHAQPFQAISTRNTTSPTLHL